MLIEGSFTSDGLGATTPNPLHQDSQLPAGEATFSRQESFSFSSGGGSFSRPQSPNNTAPQGFTGAGATTLHRDGSATTEVMDVDEYPSTRSAKTGGSELFDMGSLRNGVVAEQHGLSPRRMLGKTRSSSSSAMVGSRTSSMQYRGSGGAGRGSKFWSDDDDEDNDEDMNDPEGDSEDDNYGRRGSGRQQNRHMVCIYSYSFFTLDSHIQGITLGLVHVDNSNYSVLASIYRLGIWMEGDEGGIRMVRSAAGLIMSGHQHHRVEFGPKTSICPISSQGTRPAYRSFNWDFGCQII